jgi:hypothetical protein
MRRRATPPKFATLGRGDEMVVVGEEKDGYVQVKQGGDGSV